MGARVIFMFRIKSAAAIAGVCQGFEVHFARHRGLRCWAALLRLAGVSVIGSSLGADYLDYLADERVFRDLRAGLEACPDPGIVATVASHLVGYPDTAAGWREVAVLAAERWTVLAPGRAASSCLERARRQHAK